VLISKGEDIRTKGTHRRRSEEYPLYSTTTTTHKDNSCGSKKEREREREIKKKKERKRQGNCHFNQPYLSGFCVVLYEKRNCCYCYKTTGELN
jgi:hypothetical protein